MRRSVMSDSLQTRKVRVEQFKGREGHFSRPEEDDPVIFEKRRKGAINLVKNAHSKLINIQTTIMNSELKSITSDQQEGEHVCLRCNQSEQQLLQLECQHTFCLTCVAYMHLKFQKELQNVLLIKCLKCGFESEIGESELKMIEGVISDQVLPFIVREEERDGDTIKDGEALKAGGKEDIKDPHRFNRIRSEFKNAEQMRQGGDFRNQSNQSEMRQIIFSELRENSASRQTSQIRNTQQTSIEKPGARQYTLSGDYVKQIDATGLKSSQPSLTQLHSINKVLHSNNYLSHPSSPENPSFEAPSVEHCSIHTMEELSFVCFTCGNSLLCLRCVTERKHCSHEVKNVKKGIEHVEEQMALTKMIAKQQIENLQLWRRRLQDRQNIIKDRWGRLAKELRQTFAEVVHKINQKSSLILETCEVHYSALLAELHQESQKIDTHILHMKTHVSTLASTSQRQSQLNATDFIRRANEVIESSSQSMERGQSEMKKVITDKVPYPNNHLYLQIAQISDLIDGIHVEYKFTSIFKGNVESKDIFRADRPKTNLGSMNTSRERRKCTKTEEDQRRVRSKLNMVPAYIKPYLEVGGRHNTEQPCQFAFSLDPTLNHTLQNSFKSSGKSKMTVEDSKKKKRKDLMGIFKEKLEKKGSGRQKTTNKTKKIHF